MKRFLFFVVASFYSIAGLGSTIRWDGGGADGLWATALNWVGDAVPGALDDVILDNANGVASTYTVTLPGGAVSVTVNSLTITPSGSNNITLLNPVANTSPTAFTANGAGDAVVLNNGAIFKNSSGAASGSPVSVTTTNFFRINNGGRYIHNCDRAHTATLVARLSAVAGTENGTFEFDVPLASFTFSLNGRVYGNLELSSAAQGSSVTYLSSGSAISTINGNLIINAGVTFTLDFTNDIVIKGNLNQSPSTILNLSNSTGSNVYKISGNVNSAGTITETGIGFPEISLNGLSNQNITATGTITNNVTVSLNNTAGATLLAGLTLPYKLQLITGNIKTTASSLLILTDNATCAGGSTASYVNGPMKKIGNDAFVFPVGFGDLSGDIYAPLGMANGAGELTSDEFTAEYKRANPQSTAPYSSAHDPFLDHVSYMEYWTFAQNAGSSTKKMSLDVHLSSFCKHVDHTYISGWNGSQWTYEPSVISSGPVLVSGYETGTIQSMAAISGFTPGGMGFTLSTDQPFTANPLPIHLISFDATKLGNTRSSVTWELAAYCSPATKFEIQRTGGGRGFMTIGIVAGNETNKFYNYSDNSLQNGINYYRLKMTDQDGNINYSRTVGVMNGVNTSVLTSLIPTYVTNTAALTISSPGSQQLDLFIFDMQGNVVKKQNYMMSRGNSTIVLVTAGLPAGVYQLIGIVAGRKTNVIAFFKR